MKWSPQIVRSKVISVFGGVLLLLAPSGLAASANDNFAAAAVGTGTSFSIQSDSKGATRENGERVANGERTLWFKWTAPSNLNVTISTLGSGDRNDDYLAAYHGSALSQMNEIASDNKRFSSGPAQVKFPAVAGLSYYFVVGSGDTTATDGTTVLSLSSLPRNDSTELIGPTSPTAGQPVNDSFLQAQAASGSQFTIVGYSMDATRENGERIINGERTLWYKWTAPANLDVTVSTLGSVGANDDYLTVYHGSALNQLNKVGYQDNRFSSNPAQVTFPVVTGLTYYFVVGSGETSTVDGTMFLSLSSIPRNDTTLLTGPVVPTAGQPFNDSFANAQSMSGAQFKVLGYSADATRENGERTTNGERTLWYKWTAPANLDVTVSTLGSVGVNDDYLTVYHGSTFNQLNKVGYIDNRFNSEAAQVTFPVVAGLSYYFVVGSASTATDDGTMLLSLASVPRNDSTVLAGPADPTAGQPFNDSFANAQAMSGVQFKVLGYSADATRENGERTADGERTLWYKWIAPTNALVTVSTLGSIRHNQDFLTAYHGTALNQLNEVAYDDNQFSSEPAQVTFPAIAGRTYYFVIGSNNTTADNGVTFLNLSAAPASFFGVVLGPPTPGFAQPPNDSFANARVLPITQLTAIGYNADATREVSEPDTTGYRTLWYSWTAQQGGYVAIKGTGTDFQHTISVYSGAQLGALQNLASEDGSLSDPAEVSFYARPGATYHISIGGRYSDRKGSAVLTLRAAGPVVFSARGRYSGSFGNPDAARALQLSVTATGALTGKLFISGRGFVITGQFPLSGFLPLTIGSVALQLQIDPLGESRQVTGVFTYGGVSETFALDRTIFSVSRPAPQAGVYTILIAPDETTTGPTNKPPGFGRGTLTVSADGTVNFAARLPDGAAVSQGGWVSNRGTWFINQALYRNGGQVSGEVTFRDSPNVSDLDGSLYWKRPPLLTTSYANGFVSTIQLLGSRYRARRPVLDLAAPIATLTNGDLPASATIPFPAVNRVITQAGGLTLRFDLASGLLTGSYLPTGARTPIVVVGAVFQKQNRAAGYFLGASQSGLFEFGN